ncbi:MAG: hypothetical protein ACOCRO_06990 [Halanaerobiales bacterium]
MNKKTTKIILLFFVFTICFISGIILGEKTHLYSYTTSYYKHDPLKTMTDNSDLDIPLPKASDITFEKENIRLDLEKISASKYFIVYSALYGDQSHTAYHLYLSNLQKEKIKKNEIQKVYLKSKDNQIIEIIAEKLTIRDFPEDIPLEWKIKIIAKFPYQKEMDNHKLILLYQDKEYILSNITYGNTSNDK